MYNIHTYHLIYILEIYYSLVIYVSFISSSIIIENIFGWVQEGGVNWTLKDFSNLKHWKQFSE